MANIYIKCVHCGLLKCNEHQQDSYSRRGRLLGTQCFNCNEEVDLYIEDSVGHKRKIDQDFLTKYLNAKKELEKV